MRARDSGPVRSGRGSGNLSDGEGGGSDDPVRMYLREMGSVELLSRDGEMAIAKRIEAGRELMIGGIYESPMSLRVIIEWMAGARAREEPTPLRDIIELEKTYLRLNGSGHFYFGFISWSLCYSLKGGE